MYLEHFGLAEVPFRITPHTDFFFAGANRGATLEALMYAITHDEGIVKVSGEVGSGKTMLCRVLMERLPEHVTLVYLANPSLSRDDILYAIADELRLVIPDHSRRSVLLRTLQEHLISLYADGRQVVVLIDEAHAMPAESLEEVRLLSNLESNRHKLMQLVLFGQPELNAVLARSDMRQLKERITHNFALEPLVRDDIANYIDFRMRAAGYKGPSLFAPAAVREIANASMGLTRRINILADKSLLAAFSQGTHQITAKHVRAAIADSEFGTLSQPASRRWTLVAAAAGAIALLLVAALWLMRGDKEAATPTASPNPSASTTVAPQPITPPSPQTPPPTSAAPSVPVPAVIPVVAAPVAGTPRPESPPKAWEKLPPGIQQRLAKHQPWFEQTPDEHWFIQLLGTDSTHVQRVESMLAGADALLDPSHVRVYFVEMRNSERIGVIYGEYKTRREALEAIKQLPQELKPFRPYPRQMLKLR